MRDTLLGTYKLSVFCRVGSSNTLYILSFSSGGHAFSYLKQIILEASIRRIKICIVGSSASNQSFSACYPDICKYDLLTLFEIPDLACSRDNVSHLSWRFVRTRYQLHALRMVLSCVDSNTTISRESVLLLGGDVYLPFINLFLPGSCRYSILLIRPPYIGAFSFSMRYAIKAIMVLAYSVLLGLDPRIQNIHYLNSTKVSPLFLWLLRSKISPVPDPVQRILVQRQLVSGDILNTFDELLATGRKIKILFYGAFGPRKQVVEILESLILHRHTDELSVILAGIIPSSYLCLLLPLVHRLRARGASTAVFNRYISDHDEAFLFANSTYLIVYNRDSTMSSGVILKGVAHGLGIITSSELAVANNVLDYKGLVVLPMSDLSSFGFPSVLSSDLPPPQSSLSCHEFSSSILSSMMI